MPEAFQSSVLEQLSELREDTRSLRDHVDSQVKDLREEHRENTGTLHVALRDISRRLDGGSDPERGLIARLQQAESDAAEAKRNQQEAIKADKANRKRRTNLLWAGVGAAVMAGSALVGERLVRAVMPEVPEVQR